MRLQTKWKEIIAIWKIIPKSSKKRNWLIKVSCRYVYIYTHPSVFFLFFWPYSYQTNEVTNLHAIAAEDERGRNLYSCETRESDEKKVTDIEKLTILYNGNVFFRVSIEKGIIQVTLFNFVYKYSYLSIIGEMQKKKKKK